MTQCTKINGNDVMVLVSTEHEFSWSHVIIAHLYRPTYIGLLHKFKIAI